MKATVHTIDLKFMGLPGSIAVYALPHSDGVALVESGPGSTLPALESGLKDLGYSFADITDVFLTHIHLDHAGAAGWLARQGARIHLHPVGAPHMLAPEKLLASATRIYGEHMDRLWGEFLGVPADRLSVLEDNQVVEINRLCVKAVDTPGHANHHFTYLHGDIAFTGDIGGVRLGGLRFLRLPMPPPDLDIEKWRQSLQRLKTEFAAGNIERVAPTHFGIYDDAEWHLGEVAEALDEVEAWIEQIMPTDPPIEHLRQEFIQWTEGVTRARGLDQSVVSALDAANPAFMSADGIARYWRKHRAAQT